MSRRALALAGILVGAALALACWLWSQRSDAPSGPKEVAVTTPDGSLSFRIPSTWLTQTCGGNDSCLEVLAPGQAADAASSVMWSEGNEAEGTPLDLIANPEAPMPGVERLTIDGQPAGRLVSTEVDPMVVVVGRARSGPESTFMIMCPDTGSDVHVTVCAQVVRTLKVLR